jgi:hypothetical protein
MTDQAISPLCRRMIEDMAIRKLAPKTQHDYVSLFACSAHKLMCCRKRPTPRRGMRSAAIGFWPLIVSPVDCDPLLPRQRNLSILSAR